jgi:CheY-like chemotaxis protein
MGEEHPTFNVLCVDDHADTLVAMAKLLQQRGHAVTTARGYGDAMLRARRQRLDVLVADVGLPDGNGLELLSELQSLYPIPGIVVSGYAMPNDVDRALTAGYAMHLSKPIDVPQLFKAVERLGHQRVAAAAVATVRAGDRPTV